jgi:hypothetical protein
LYSFNSAGEIASDLEALKEVGDVALVFTLELLLALLAGLDLKAVAVAAAAAEFLVIRHLDMKYKKKD